MFCFVLVNIETNTQRGDRKTEMNECDFFDACGCMGGKAKMDDVKLITEVYSTVSHERCFRQDNIRKIRAVVLLL